MEIVGLPGVEKYFYNKTVQSFLKKDQIISEFWPEQSVQNVLASKQKQWFKCSEKRRHLQTTLLKQYNDSGIELVDALNVKANIDALADDNTYTVTTGQQIHVLGGPLYVLYKIADTIRLAKEYELLMPERKFVPVFWMATEDHDFQEINSFTLFGKSFVWDTTQTGAVGRMNTDELEPFFEELISSFQNDAIFLNLFDEARKVYTQAPNFSIGSRLFFHTLFKDSGLVILDPDDLEFKKFFAPLVKKEFLEKVVSESVLKSTDKMHLAGLNTQANPREINLFYLIDNFRSRIVADQGKYSILDSEIAFSETELLAELHNHPERFSPNVFFRPIYQECILPNITYVGGPAEIVYWMQTSSAFDTFGIQRPVLNLRSSHIAIKLSLSEQIKAQVIEVEMMFRSEDELKNLILEKEGQNVDVTELELQLKSVKEQFVNLLYKFNHPELKAYKAKFEELEKSIKKEGSAMKENLADSAVIKPKIDKMLKLKAQYFNTSQPQERVQPFIQHFGNVEKVQLFIDKLCKTPPIQISLLID